MRALVLIWQDRGPKRFVRLYRKPHAFFRHSDRFTAYVPLLEMDGECIYAFNATSGEYVEHYYEENQPTIIGKSYQQLVAWLFVDLGYAGLADLAIEVAPMFEFKHTQGLLDFLEIDDDQPLELAKERFVNALAQ